MRKNEHRKVAEETFLTDRGRITNKELAKKLGIHPATIARWKKLDEWDRKLVQSVTSPYPAAAAPQDDLSDLDLRHINTLNERIDTYLQKKELLSSEILDLAQAKFHLMGCMEIIAERMTHAEFEDYEEDEEEKFD